MTIGAIRKYHGPGFILSAGRITEIGEPHLRMSTPRAAAAPTPARRVPTIRAELIYAARRVAIENAAPADRAEPENIFTASGSEAVYARRSA